MSFGLPMSDEVWSFFVEEINGVSKAPATLTLSDWEYKWLAQVDALSREELDLSDPFRPAVQFKLRYDEYWIAMSPGKDFPNNPPIVKCAYQQGFSFDWYPVEDVDEQPSTLADLVRSYREYCEAIDIAISQIKLLDNSLTTLIGYFLHEDDNQCFAVKLRLKPEENETITIFVDWQNPQDFPRHISSTNEERFANLNCDVWEPSEDLCANMERILSEFEDYDLDV